MATATLSSLLKTLTESLSAADASLCDEADLAPPVDGISLFDTKNELFLSYLQNLVFLIILKLRASKATDNNDKSPDLSQLSEGVVKRLVENRVYIEKGVRPLETRLRYQIDKVVRAADDAALKDAAQGKGADGKSRKPRSNGIKQKPTNNGSSSDDDDDENDSFQSSSDDNDDSNDEDDNRSSASSSADPHSISALSHRPNLSAFTKPQSHLHPTTTSIDAPDAPYRPPKIAPTIMPGLDPDSSRSRAEKPQRSAHLEEFIADEMSGAPVMEPSVGTTIARGGRSYKSSRERKDELDRQTYEEANFVRLPPVSKKEKRKQAGRRKEAWGGEDWRDLGAGADRIGTLVERRKGSGGALERSRKRDRDEGGGEEVRMGKRFEKRRRTLERRRR